MIRFNETNKIDHKIVCKENGFCKGYEYNEDSMFIVENRNWNLNKT